MKTTALDYTLPDDLIAQVPIEPRDRSRLLVLHRDSGQIEHRMFIDIGSYLRSDDTLVANESRVIPARMAARKEPSGGRVEVLLLRKLDDLTWRALLGGARTREGSSIRLLQDDHASSLTAQVIESGDRGERTLRFVEPVERYFETLGHMPLPPYIHVPLRDPERYQTIYARTLGSAAAPTAGLHFTPDLLLALRDAGVRLAYVTLHVGLDTFRPITELTVESHRIHSEWCRVDTATAERINRTKVMGRRAVAVGTTSMRVLETAARQGLLQTPSGVHSAAIGDVPVATCPWQPLSPFEGFTDLYITPGFQFRIVDALVTNFHLPRSSLLALVMAFAGEDLIRDAYQTAIRERYRFFSFGDAMLIL
ncbi:MAG: tRNA preQ1(34) S-adenosylmethionine ribosyltransferase-isomerase QueA [Anaerolineae bacterium]|jgi:S-adenosylmethionine:tRNA ribosyltransferase-isomerase|nr:tRNA preQ1(34) S-adenosylmethionine ribosyltransferase-isomerase QueA [Anaerolineae bacterium]